MIAGRFNRYLQRYKIRAPDWNLNYSGQESKEGVKINLSQPLEDHLAQNSLMDKKKAL